MDEQRIRRMNEYKKQHMQKGVGKCTTAVRWSACQDNIHSDVTGIFFKKKSLCNSPIEGVWCVLAKKKKDCVTDAMPCENSRRGRKRDTLELLLWFQWWENQCMSSCFSRPNGRSAETCAFMADNKGKRTEIKGSAGHLESRTDCKWIFISY